MKYIILGIVVIIVMVLSLIHTIFIDTNLVVKIICIPLDIIAIILSICLIIVGRKLIKNKKRIEMLRMWPKNN